MEAPEPSEEDSDPVQLNLSLQIVGSKPWLLASQRPYAATCSPSSRIRKRPVAIAEAHAFVIIGKKSSG